jgi:hypothetical protein
VKENIWNDRERTDGCIAQWSCSRARTGSIVGRGSLGHCAITAALCLQIACKQLAEDSIDAIAKCGNLGGFLSAGEGDRPLFFLQ